MAELVPDILILSDGTDGTVAGGAWHTANQTFSDNAKSQLAGREMVVLVAGQNVRILAHDLPALKPRERMEAARFQIEPDIGQAGEAAHIVIGEDRLAVVDRRHMQSIVDALSEAGVAAISIHADHDVLPPATLPDRIITEAATLDHGFPLGDRTPAELDYRDALVRADLSRALDLQSGDFARRRSFAPGVPSGWMKAAAVLAAFVGLSWGALQWSESRAEAAQIADLRERAVSAYERATGERIADPARAVRALPANTGPDAGALELMGVLFAALDQVPGATVDTLNFSNETRELDLRLAYPGFDAPPQLERIVRELGGELSAGGVRETGGRFIGDATLTISGTG